MAIAVCRWHACRKRSKTGASSQGRTSEPVGKGASVCTDEQMYQSPASVVPTPIDARNGSVRSILSISIRFAHFCTAPDSNCPQLFVKHCYDSFLVCLSLSIPSRFLPFRWKFSPKLTKSLQISPNYKFEISKDIYHKIISEYRELLKYVELTTPWTLISWIDL